MQATGCRLAGADQRNLMAIRLVRRPRQPVRNVVTVVRRHPLQSANRDRFVLHTTASTRRLARPIANATEYAGEYVRLAVKHVGVGKSALRYEAYVVWNISVSRARPLTVDDLVKVICFGCICWLHSQVNQLTPAIDALASAAVSSPFGR